MKNVNGKFRNVSDEYGLDNEVGWWFRIEEKDMDRDGDPDYIFGNLGLNYKYKASHEFPFEVYGGDFDDNGKGDIVLGYYNFEKLYPVRGRSCSSEQIPYIKKKFATYDEFGKATLSEVYSDMGLDEGLHYQATNFASQYVENRGKEGFVFKQLPNRAQISPINGIIPRDFDNDNILDILIAGNLYVSEIETPRADAGVGLMLKGDGQGGFAEIKPTDSGFEAAADVKNMLPISLTGGKKAVLIAVNDGELRLVEILK
jgi:hypothetical protein